MKLKILLLSLLIGILSSCNKPQHFSNKQLKNALSTCLNDKHFKLWMFPGSAADKQARLHLFGNALLNDSLKIGERVYYIGKGTGNVSKDTIFVYRFHYKTETTASIHFIYQPGNSYRIFSNSDFVFDNNEWKMQNQSTGIMDGRF